jgi:hypothetical protein
MVCGVPHDTIVLVVQLYRRSPLTVPCLQEARHERFRQYVRGGAIDVWLVPARNVAR